MPNMQTKKGRSKSLPPFVMLPHWMMALPAWRSLSPQTRVVHLELLRLYNGSNNGRIALSVRDAASRCNIAKDTAAKCLRELVEKGFTEVVNEAAFAYKLRHATEYRLTHLRCDKTGAMPSKSYARWKAIL